MQSGIFTCNLSRMAYRPLDDEYDEYDERDDVQLLISDDFERNELVKSPERRPIDADSNAVKLNGVNPSRDPDKSNSEAGQYDSNAAKLTRGTQVSFDALHGYRPDDSECSYRECLEKCFPCARKTFARQLCSLFPFVEILKRYDVRSDLTRDLLAGLTVCVMHIPQGMAYGMLAHVPPVYGLYSSIFPVLVYFVFGTSRHISVGTFAVVTLMVSGPVMHLTQSLTPFRPNSTSDAVAITTLTPNEASQSSSHVDNDLLVFGDAVLTRDQCHVQIAIAVTLLTGLIQVAMAMLRLGFLTVYFSQPMVNGFTTGAAFHVMTSQIVYVIGYKTSRPFSGPFKLICIYCDLLEHYKQFNSVAFAISVVCVTILMLFKELVQPRVAKRVKLPIPIDLVLIVLGTGVSYALQLNLKYGVFTIGHIPSGFPPPQVPAVRLFAQIWMDCLLIAVVSYAITVSMAKIFAAKHGYQVRGNQELLALGLSNTVSSFLNCHANSASLSRSIVQEGAGCRSQVTSLVSCAGLVLVILFIAPLFESVPNCVLASIILVALKGLFVQFSDLPKLWRTSKYDYAIWLVTCASTVLVDVPWGLVIGLLFSVSTLIYRSQSSELHLLGQVRNTGIYEDVHTYRDAKETDGVQVFRFDGPLHFASVDNFRESLQRQTRLPTNTGSESESESVCRLAVHHLVLDCSAVTFLDSAGAKALADLVDQCAQLQVTFFLACTNSTVRQSLERFDFFKRRPRDSLFVTVDDAVQLALRVASNKSLAANATTTDGAVAASCSASVPNACRDIRMKTLNQNSRTFSFE